MTRIRMRVLCLVGIFGNSEFGCVSACYFECDSRVENVILEMRMGFHIHVCALHIFFKK